MFCQNCGSELRQGLNFCNRCGSEVYSQLEKSKSLTRTAKDMELARNLSYAVGFIGFAGVAALAVLIMKIIEREFITFSAVLLGLIFGAVVLGIVSILIKQISALSANHAFSSAQSSEQASAQLREKQTGQLNNHVESFPIGSVTEQTTRSFDVIPFKKQ